MTEKIPYKEPGSDKRLQPKPEQATKSKISLDGESVEVEKELGENIAIALRMQEKIDEAIITGGKPGLLKMVSMLNCRKAISAVRGTNSLGELVSRKKLQQGKLSAEDREELSGLPELVKDIESILDTGHYPVLGSQEDMHIASYFDEHPEDLPAVVHTFDILPRYESSILNKLISHSSALSIEDALEKMHRNHTFLVLGKSKSGKYICFQKQGPKIHHKFELRELNSLINLSVDPTEDQVLLSFIRPISRDGEYIEENEIKKLLRYIYYLGFN